MIALAQSGLAARLRRAAVLFALAILTADGARAAGPFDPFIGEWHGDGVVSTSDGQQAPLRCKVDVVAEVGERAGQVLRCASTGAVIVINASMRLSGGEEPADGAAAQDTAGETVIGSWSNDRGKSGGLKGSIDSDSLQVDLAGDDVDARMVSAIDGCKLRVSIDGALGKISTLQVDLQKGC